jgi:hypothetical protein
MLRVPSRARCFCSSLLARLKSSLPQFYLPFFRERRIFWREALLIFGIAAAE